MIRKLIRKFKKKPSTKPRVETDGVPVEPREAALPISIPQERLLANNETQGHPNVALGPPEASRSMSPNSLLPGMRMIPTVNLSVSNSHGFHIGDVQNISVGEGGVANFNLSSSGLSDLGNSLNNLQTSQGTSRRNSLADKDALETVFDKIKDWEVSFIGENAGTDWKALGSALDMQQNRLNDIETRTKSHPQEAVTEVLRQYLADFPDTSLGYIASVLKESGHGQAVAQLAKLRS